ncbi:protein of unknown function [Bradyrhizobium vignae]|uniref:Uncharacterized protein n=1 Tax=Bradyrhizobium vignae TaxID=1549949 RepID=A0A2U3Q6X3_9BRAD|nr:protein of unknown function [Bradyrhizobium vignae]
MTRHWIVTEAVSANAGVQSQMKSGASCCPDLPSYPADYLANLLKRRDNFCAIWSVKLCEARL